MSEHAHDEHSNECNDDLNGHSHDLKNQNMKRVAIVFSITMGFMVVEAVGGYLTNSLALLSDAGHMLTDAGALGLVLFAFWLASKPVSPEHNFGYHRFEILAAFINGVVLLMLAVLIVREAYHRIGDPPDVKVQGMLAIAIGGLIINLIGAYILSRGDTDNLNMRGALFHVAGDALGSVGAIIAALLIMFTGWKMADPIVSFLIAGIIVVGAIKLVDDSTHIILEGTPKKINLVDVEGALLDHPHITNVHDLHVWTITSGFESMSAHVVLDEQADDSDCILADLGKTLMEKFNIEHTTIQIELEHCEGVCCVTCPTREAMEAEGGIRPKA